MAEQPSGHEEDPVTDEHRDAAIDALRTAAGEARIDLEEFGDRAGVVYGATRLDEIRSVLSDLGADDLPVLAPTPTPATSPYAHLPPPPPPPPREAQYVVAVMSGAVRKGTWRAKAQIHAVSVMGGCKLDFRNAELSAPVTQVNAVTIMGGVEIVVPEGVPVEVDGFVLMGGVDNKTRGEPAPGAPMIRVSAFGLMGGVTVRHPSRRRRRSREPLPGPAESLPPVLPLGAPEGTTTDGATVTLLCTQLVGSTAMAESLGDQRWFEVLRSHSAVLREQFVAHAGEVVKTQGDSFMVSFSSVRQALLCAIAIQRALVPHRTVAPGVDIHVRIGIHSGEVIAADGDVFGRNVDLTTRIVTEARADEVLVSTVTKQLAEAGGDLDFGAGRPTELRGMSGEWVLHDLRWRPG